MSTSLSKTPLEMADIVLASNSPYTEWSMERRMEVWQTLSMLYDYAAALSERLHEEKELAKVLRAAYARNREAQNVLGD